MIRIYSRLAIPLIIIFIALNIAARALGSTQPPKPALRGFVEGCEGKPQPCWYGIVPGVTRLFQVKQWAIDNGFREIESWYRGGIEDRGVYIVGGICREYDTQPPIRICFLPPDYTTEQIVVSANTVNLYDFISVLGFPSKISRGDHDIPIISFGGTVLASVQTLDWWGFSNLSGHLPVEEWLIYKEHINLYRFRWHGFKSRWHYCQLEFETPTC